MRETLYSWFPWLDFFDGYWKIIGIISIIFFIISIATLPWLASQIPQDYFMPEARMQRKQQNIVTRLIVMIFRNIAGIILLLMGMVMLIGPGQGLITIIVAIMLLDFPGKFRLERWLISRPGILKAINWLRNKKGRVPLQVPETTES
jgi:hypothetical protein